MSFSFKREKERKVILSLHFTFIVMFLNYLLVKNLLTPLSVDQFSGLQFQHYSGGGLVCTISQTLIFGFLGVLASLKVSGMIYWGSRYYLLTCALLVLPVYRFDLWRLCLALNSCVNLLALEVNALLYQELFTLPEHLSSVPVFSEIHVA